MPSKPIITSKQITCHGLRKFHVSVGLEFKGAITKRQQASGWERGWTATIPAMIVGTFTSFDDAVNAIVKA